MFCIKQFFKEYKDFSIFLSIYFQENIYFLILSYYTEMKNLSAAKKEANNTL